MSKILNVFQKLHLHALIEVLQLTVPSSNAASQCLPNSLQAQESYPHPQRYFIRDSYFRVRLPKIIHWLYLLLDKVDIHLILSQLCVDHFENQWTTLQRYVELWKEAHSLEKKMIRPDCKSSYSSVCVLLLTDCNWLLVREIETIRCILIEKGFISKIIFHQFNIYTGWCSTMQDINI